MYCSLAVTPCTLPVDDAMLCPFDFSQSYAGSLVDDCVRYLRTLGTVSISEAPRFYFWFTTVQHYHAYGQWVVRTPLSVEHASACKQRLAAFVDAIGKLFLPAWLNGTRRPVSHSGCLNDLYVIRSAAGEMHWQLLQAYKGYPDPKWILQRDLDPYVLAAHMHPCPDAVDVGALFSAAESSRLPGMGESQEDSANCGESPAPIPLEPPRAEPSSMMTETSETYPFEAEAEEPLSSPLPPSFVLLTEEPDHARRWTWPPAKAEAPLPARPLRVVGPMPDLANMHHEMVDGDGLTTSKPEVDAPTDTSDESCDEGTYYVDENGWTWWINLNTSALENYYFDDDIEGAPSGSDGDSDRWDVPESHCIMYRAPEDDGGSSTTETWTTEDDEEWYSSEVYSTPSPTTTRHFIE